MLLYFPIKWFDLGRGRRPGVGRGRRNLSSMMINASQSQGPPQAETAQIMLSLSGNNASTPTSRSVYINPNTGSTILNGSLSTTELTDLKALREQLNLEPRRRGRRRQNFGLGRGRMKDSVEGKFGIHNIKKEVDDIQQKDGVLFKPLDSKLNLLNNNGNNDAKSPLLASLLSKAEALAKAKVKTENDAEDGQTEQETVLFQFDGESSGASKYLDALKEAGLPTDVPVLIDNGDGNYVTLTEDVLMNVLGNSEEFQFQVTEATLEQGDVSEGVVLQDGTIMMTGKNGKSDLTGPILTVGKKPITIKGVREPKGKRGPKPKLLAGKEIKPKATRVDASPKKAAKQEVSTKKTVQELINEAMLESLKNGAANEAESDPDAVVLFEVTGNDKVCKYVVSSKEVNALKALNEQIEKHKKLDSPTKKECILPTVIDGNTNIAEIKLTMSTNPRKSIVSEVLARAHSHENQVKAASMLNELPKSTIKVEDSSSQILNINIDTDVLNDSSQFINLNSEENNLDNSNMMELGDEPQILDENSGMVLDNQNELIRIKEQDEDINVNENENLMVGDHESLIVVNNSSGMLQEGDLDLAEEPSEGSQLMNMNESSQDGVGEDTEDATEDISGEDTDGTIPQGGRDMPLLESESQLVELEFIDGDGQKLEGYQVEGTVLSQKEISALAGLNNETKDSEVIGLLDMVCEEAASSQDDLSNEVLNDVSTLKQITSSSSSIKASVQSTGESISQSEFRVNESETGTEHLVLQEVQNIEHRHLQEAEMLDEDGECQDLSVEQALQAMMGDGSNTIVESEEFNQEINPSNQDQRCSNLNQLESSESINNLDNPNNFEFDYEAIQNPTTEGAQVISIEPEMNVLPDESTNKIMAELKPLNPDDVMEESVQPTIISPTKDVPFAVGLLPLKDALVQFQSIQDHQPRKTRSGSISKPEVNGTKRRSSSEQPGDGTVKRRKSTENESSSSTNQNVEVSVNPSA